MKKYLWLILFIFLFIQACDSNKEQQIQQETSVETAPYDGLTLYAPQAGNVIYLANNDQEIVQSWTVETNPFAKLLADGTLLYISGASSSPTKPATGTPAITHISWDGDVLWRYENSLLHHDFVQLSTDNIVVIVWEKVTDENKEKYFPDSVGDLWTDVLLELDYETQEIVWEWHVQDHLDVLPYSSGTIQRSEITHTNAVEYLPTGNSFTGEESFLLSFRQLDTIIIVEKESGEVIWDYGSGILHAQHNPTLLENGNILVFDNQYRKEKSRIVEIDPETKSIVWEYTAPDFYSDHISGVQRLANGNTLICEGTSGRIFEVNSEGVIVWDFSPTISGKDKDIFRAYKYGFYDVNWPDEVVEEFG